MGGEGGLGLGLELGMELGLGTGEGLGPRAGEGVGLGTGLKIVGGESWLFLIVHWEQRTTLEVEPSFLRLCKALPTKRRCVV